MYAKTYVFGNKNQKLNTDSRSKETAVTGGQLYDAGLGYGFVTEADLESGKLPDHKLDLKPGDAKYKDLNGDNIIDDNDQCPIGNPIYPQLTAGITAGFEYKGFDFSMLWAGSGKVSRFISAGLRVPFGGGNYGLLQLDTGNRRNS